MKSKWRWQPMTSEIVRKILKGPLHYYGGCSVAEDKRDSTQESVECKITVRESHKQHMRFHHIGIACKDIDVTRTAMLSVGTGGLVRRNYDPQQMAWVELYRFGGGQIELVAGEAVRNVLRGRDAAQYHVCYEVDDMGSYLTNMQNNGWRVISSPKPAVLFDGRWVVFLLHADFGMIELLERGRHD